MWQKMETFLRNRIELHDLWLHSKAYPAYTAAEHVLGTTIHQTDPWLAYQFNRAVRKWGQFVDDRLAAQTEKVVEARKLGKNKTIRVVPKYSYEEALGLHYDLSAVDPQVEEEARALLTGAISMEDWLAQAE